MCVLSYGREEVVDANTNEIVERNYFIGALLEGDVPQSEQILDFARITNLFDTSRSGALYLTGSDDHAPYMDVIDGIGRNASLSWPENLASSDYVDAESQYVVSGVVDAEYLPAIEGHNRVLHLRQQEDVNDNFVGIQQDFYKYVQNPNRVLVSYKIKASRELACKMSLGYQDGTRIDGEETYTVTTDWQYKLHAVTIDYSGRYLRTLKLDLSTMQTNDEVWIADFNIILLSSIANFGDASKMRVGKLTGISDPVFGQLDGYGGYMQKLFASGSAHISGTLTAGDEHGFGATFYAGKIHRNAFVNSLDVMFVNGGEAIEVTAPNPTGIGKTYRIDGAIKMIGQYAAWYVPRIGDTYTLSFYVYADTPCQLQIQQNDKAVGTLQVREGGVWQRQTITIDLLAPHEMGEHLTFQIASVTGRSVLFAAPQLESGRIASQYQPTDDVLNYTDDYGAWFNRGGIGGTMQNPLLKLNYDGEGGIGTRNQSLLLKNDGSGYLASGNITWDKSGNVYFGDKVVMTWDNLSHTVQQGLLPKSIHIQGIDTVTLINNEYDGRLIAVPEILELSLEMDGFEEGAYKIAWFYLSGNQYVLMEGQTSRQLHINPLQDFWGNTALTVKCVVTCNDRQYVDTITIKKNVTSGYELKIDSSKGTMYKNRDCETTLTAKVLYQGQEVSPRWADHNYRFRWKLYHLPDLENEDTEWWNRQPALMDMRTPALDRCSRVLNLNYPLPEQDCFVCELTEVNAFSYVFPFDWMGGSIFPYIFPIDF